MIPENYPESIISTYKIKLRELENEYEEFMRKYNKRIKKLKKVFSQKIDNSFELSDDPNIHPKKYYFDIIENYTTFSDNNDDYDSE